MTTITEREELLARLQDATNEVLGDGAPQLTEALEFQEGIIDSLDLIEIMMIIEDDEGFVIDGDTLGEVRCIGDVMDVILAVRATQ